jgi:long-chain acyl-CoA synthetase
MTTKNEIQTIEKFIEHFASFGNKKALTDITSTRTYTYIQLKEEVETLSRKIPIKKGERVLLYENTSFDWILLFFAVTMRGGIVVSLDNRVHSSFIKEVINLTKPVLICTNKKEKIPNKNCKIFNIKELRQQKETNKNKIIVKKEDPLQIIFTSGTWSIPKGVTLSHENIMTNISQLKTVHPFAQKTTSLLFLPLSHGYAQVVGLFNPLYEGRHVVLLETINSILLPKIIQEYNIVFIPLIPKILTMLQKSILRKLSPFQKKYFPWLLKISLPLPRKIRRLIFYPIHKKLGQSLLTFTVGGAMLPIETDRFFRGLGYELLIGYGLSECSPVLTVSLDKERTSGCVGTLLPGIEGYLNDQNELCVKGKNVFLGYWPERRKPGFFCTGDICKKSNTGEIFLIGRNKNLIIFPNGDKIFAEDVENIFQKITQCEDVCAVWTEENNQLICALPSSFESDMSFDEIKNKVNKHLPSGVKVQDIIMLDKKSYIYTHTLKPNRKKIKERVLKLYQSKANTNPTS